MSRFIILFAAIILLTSAVKQDPIRHLLSQKANLKKTGLFGQEVAINLHAKGSGITEDDESYIKNMIDQGLSTYSGDSYANANFVQQKIEDNFSGRWAVQIFGEDPSWGRASHISNDKWLLYIGYGDYEWDYIIWLPEC